MSDDLGLFAEESGDPQQRGRRQERDRLRRRRRRRVVTAVAGLFALLIVGGGAVYGVSQLLRIGSYEDYDGSGSGEVVIEVERGDTTSAIGRTLVDKDVVASAAAFIEAAKGNSEIAGIQPGFYLMKQRMSGEAAVRRILADEARAGRVEIRGGMRLEDQTRPNGEVVPGILSLLAEATCAGSGGPDTCVSSEEMRTTAAQADLAALGVPKWAVESASSAEAERRLEGLIMPGIYHVQPGSSAEEVLSSVLQASAAKLQAAGMPAIAEGTGFSPYEVLTIASLIQSEAIKKDFGKVSRVIRNRLDTGMPLQFDSTINYPLDKPTLLTDPSDRERPGPYNTYQNTGLPPTPISSPSKAALDAAVNPTPGEWRYFVRCYKDGTSCFSETNEQHNAARQKAEERGAI
ncbi:UPF0755 protein [Halopolyspora algeriensis]|uniref:Endolytic murein transglycosylase n=1 Tax=Halopolyspora algeriensis TaxID=1500506 RepID=A0A368VUW9_9ACTN|nr:endolytic transglycosylase MltG [Halopolyspora algeriensis]RCW43886.1 UPF0755 protein [Halopolyspora algeriensis]TQM53611.1 UPF0755 protein [Halopolyspora algeriensis]